MHSATNNAIAEANKLTYDRHFAELAAFLGKHEFEHVFVELLGWDQAKGSVEIEMDDHRYSFDIVAQKRGFQILHCAADRRTLFNRGRLRRLQRKAASIVHEHVLIYSCEKPRKQVWQWAARTAEGHVRGHREHPFFSLEPPAPLLQRLKRLEFTLDEEESVTLLDALQRIRQALDVSADLNLFVRRPFYAEQSDELAIAMKAGDRAAFEKFVELHRPLARYFSKRLCRLFGLELDEAEHIGTIGLIKAARRFEPERGLQFSTYATNWVLATGQRLGPEAGLLIHIPQHVLWPCIRLRHTLERLQAGREPPEVRRRFHKNLLDEFGSTKPWMNFDRARNVLSLSDHLQPEFREARCVVDPGVGPSNIAILTEQIEKVRAAIDKLDSRQAEVIRLRYGIDASPLTLDEVGQQFKVTRERIRQIQAKAEERLNVLIRRVMKDDVADWTSEEKEVCNVDADADNEAILS